METFLSDDDNNNDDDDYDNDEHNNNNSNDESFQESKIYMTCVRIYPRREREAFNYVYSVHGIDYWFLIVRTTSVYGSIVHKNIIKRDFLVAFKNYI